MVYGITEIISKTLKSIFDLKKILVIKIITF